MTAHPKNDAPSGKRHPVRNILIGVAVAACLGTGAFFLYQSSGWGDQSPTAEPQEERLRTNVVTTPAAVRDFERVLAVQGNLKSKNFAMVSPRIPGTIEAIFVEEGDAVVAGQTELFATDAVNLEKNVQIKEHAMIVAQSSSREAQANLERVTVDLEKAELDYNRFKRLYEKQAVTADAFEQQQSRFRQLQAARKLAEAQVELADARKAQSTAELAIAEKDLADAVVCAPIDGEVSLRLQEPGEMGSPGQPVVRIDDTSVMEIVAFLPSQYYGAIVPGETEMRIEASGVDIGRQIIIYRSPTIHPQLRTFEIKSTLKDPPEGVTSGAIAQIAVVLEARKGLGVPSEAIQQRGGRAVVFVVEDDAARQAAVTTRIESDGWTEIHESDLTEGDAVITMGQSMVEAGTPVVVQQEEK